MFQRDQSSAKEKLCCNLLTLPISGGNPIKELFERSRTNRCKVHASSGYSCNWKNYQVINSSTWNSLEAFKTEKNNLWANESKQAQRNTWYIIKWLASKWKSNIKGLIIPVKFYNHQVSCACGCSPKRDPNFYLSKQQFKFCSPVYDQLTSNFLLE